MIHIWDDDKTKKCPCGQPTTARLHLHGKDFVICYFCLKEIKGLK